MAANGQSFANLYGTCSAPSIAPMTASDGATASFTIGFYNTCSGVNYNFTLNTTTGISLSSIPVGTYNVSIAPVGGTGTYTYTIDGFVQHTTSAIFYGITLSSSSNTLIIH